MSLLFCEKVEKKLCTDYGLNVYGKVGMYGWECAPNKPAEKVITSLHIERNGEKIYNVELGNRVIFDWIFKKTINKQRDSIIEITHIIYNGITHLLIAENTSDSVKYLYQVYNAKNKTEPLAISFDLYNKLLELFTTNPFKAFTVENYLIINGVKWENIENTKMFIIGEVRQVIDDALSHGFSFLVHNHKLYYKEDQ